LLAGLVFWYLVLAGFPWCLGVTGPKFGPKFGTPLLAIAGPTAFFNAGAEIVRIRSPERVSDSPVLVSIVTASVLAD
jgi:hypothetical protein